MAQATLVDRQIEDGQKLVDALRQDNVDVATAFWMKENEDSLWYLYVVSKTVDEKGLTPAYRLVAETMRKIGPLWVDPFEVKLIAPSNPMARDVLTIQNKYTAPIPTRYYGPRLGNLGIDEAYIYPAPQPVPPS